MPARSRQIEDRRRSATDCHVSWLAAKEQLHESQGVTQQLKLMRKEARQYFERALEINPQSVEARIGIGTLLVDDVVLRFTTSREQDVARADQLLQEALAREMNISMAHFAMGVLRRIQVRLNDSQIELQAAIALDPK